MGDEKPHFADSSSFESHTHGHFSASLTEEVTEVHSIFAYLNNMSLRRTDAKNVDSYRGYTAPFAGLGYFWSIKITITEFTKPKTMTYEKLETMAKYNKDSK